MLKLREVRFKLSECLFVFREEEVGRAKMVMALSFIQMAFDTLSSFQSERDASKRS